MNFRSLLHLFRLFVVVLLVPAIFVVIWGETLMTTPPPGPEDSDKILHFTAYFGLSLMASIAVRADTRAKYWALGFALMGGVMEIVQSQIGRDAEWLDQLANTLGALTGWGIAVIAIAILRRHGLIEDRKPGG